MEVAREEEETLLKRRLSVRDMIEVLRGKHREKNLLISFRTEGCWSRKLDQRSTAHGALPRYTLCPYLVSPYWGGICPTCNQKARE